MRKQSQTAAPSIVLAWLPRICEVDDEEIEIEEEVAIKADADIQQVTFDHVARAW